MAAIRLISKLPTVSCKIDQKSFNHSLLMRGLAEVPATRSDAILVIELSPSSLAQAQPEFPRRGQWATPQEEYPTDGISGGLSPTGGER